MSSASPVTPIQKVAALCKPGIDINAAMVTTDSDTFWKPKLSSEVVSVCKEALEYLSIKLEYADTIDDEHKSLRTPAINKRFQVARANGGKNRYLDVLPYDDSRVVLEGQTNYINASFIEGPPTAAAKLPKFIATQGPLRSTVVDFWEMVMQQRSPVIVMLTRIVDGRQEKCAPYFPCGVGESQVFGRLQVTNKSFVTSRFSLAKRIFQVERLETEEPPLHVLHIEYLDWPDHGVPASTTPIRELFRCLASIPEDDAPIVVHCSAGIGRTGTYIAIDYALRRLMAGERAGVKLDDIVKHLRLCRAGMVEMKAQYAFCHIAIMEELEDLVSMS